MNNHRSTELNELSKAMSLAQAEIKVAVKDSDNPFFKSKYANLKAVIETSRPALCKNGLSVMQQIIPNENGQDTLVTMLCHTSGQWISSQMRIAPAKTDVQSLGSYITYLRRYSYAALIGVYDGDEDDDGNTCSLASMEQVKIIQSYTANSSDLYNNILMRYAIKDLRQMKETDAAQLIAHLSKQSK